MGERAVAAVQRGREYDIYYSQWAGSDRLLARVLEGPAGSRLAALCSADWHYRETRPPGDPLDGVDALGTEAVFLLSARWTTVYHPVWLGFTPGETGGQASDGVLVRIETLDERRRLRAAVQFLKGTLHRALDVGLLAESTASALLGLALLEYCPAGRVHVPGTSDTASGSV